jgi:hypothetical protein
MFQAPYTPLHCLDREDLVGLRAEIGHKTIEVVDILGIPGWKRCGPCKDDQGMNMGRGNKWD